MATTTELTPLTDAQVSRMQDASLGLGVSQFTEHNIDARTAPELTARLGATLAYRHYPLYGREAERIWDRLREAAAKREGQGQGALARYRKRLYAERGAKAGDRQAAAVESDLERTESCLALEAP